MFGWLFGKRHDDNDRVYAAIERNEEEQEFVSGLIGRLGSNGKVRVSDEELARYRAIQRRVGR